MSDGHPLPLGATVCAEERAIFLHDVFTAFLADTEELTRVARFSLFGNHRQKNRK